MVIKPYFVRKLGKMSQYLLSAAGVIDVLRVNRKKKCLLQPSKINISLILRDFMLYVMFLQQAGCLSVMYVINS